MKVSDMKRMMVVTLAIAAVGLMGSNFTLAQNQQTMKMDTAPGPAHEVIDGEVTKIEGDVYTVLSGYSDNGSASQTRGWGGSLTRHEYRVLVGKETKKIKGDKKVGDRVRVEITAGGFANSIQ